MRVLGVLLGVLAFLGVAPGDPRTLHWDSTSCHLVRPIPGNPLGSLSFLGKDAQGLALFQALWDAHHRLRVCIRQDGPELITAFRALCARQPSQHSFIHTPGPELQRALATLQSQWEACQGTKDSPTGAREKRATGQSGASDREHLRRRRGWTIPGTLWCGVGNSAGNSSELGEPQEWEWVSGVCIWDGGFGLQPVPHSPRLCPWRSDLSTLNLSFFNL